MKKYKGFSIGDRVTVKKTDTAYNGFGNITSNMIGTIKAFPPKVRIIKGELFDSLPYFAYVVFNKTQGIHNNHYRGGIDICNIQKLR